MMYTVKRIDEDLDFGCEERLDDAPVMALVTLVDSSGKEVTVKAERRHPIAPETSTGGECPSAP